MCAKFEITRATGASVSCYDLTSTESFWSDFKHEYFYRRVFATMDDLRDGITDCINFCNYRQCCAEAGGVGPICYELPLVRAQQHTA
jgi:putative transposase